MPEKYERCESVYDQSRCIKAKGHYGKHLNTENQILTWTNGGLERFLREQEQVNPAK